MEKLVSLLISISFLYHTCANIISGTPVYSSPSEDGLFFSNSAANQNQSEEHTVEEIHHATCSISSDDVAATANATITRQLRGICTSAHLDNRLDTLEKIIFRELNDLKELILSYEPINAQIKSNEINYHNNHINYETKKNTFLKSNKNYKNEDYNHLNSVIYDEIKEKNMTFTKDDSGITFIYYWKMDNIIDIMASKEITQSGDFHFAGYHLYVRLIPQLFNNKNIFIQIIGIGEFNLAHQFSILSQTDTEHDIFSPIFINCAARPNQIEVECEGFEVSKDILISKKLIKNDVLILKLMIYL